MLDNILHLREVRVEDVMVCRSDIEAIEIKTSLGDVIDLFERSAHSRMPVYSVSLDEPCGMIHIRDVLACIVRLSRPTGNIKREEKTGSKEKLLDLSSVELEKTVEEMALTRKILFVPPSMPVSDLIAQMQTSRIQMALVIDEYGGTDGLVSLEDLLEMVVGDIEDEHDDETSNIIENEEGVFIVDARADIEDVSNMIGSDFLAEKHSEHIHTIGGMILTALGRVPVSGEIIQVVPGFEFHVLEADPRRVKRVRIIRVDEKEGLNKENTIVHR